MPRGNTNNLKSEAHKLTAEDKRKGGQNSGKARREKADLKRCLEILLETEMKDKNGKEISGAEALTAKLFKSALKGDVRAFEVLRDTAGQKPVERVLTAEVDQSVIDEVESLVKDD